MAASYPVKNILCRDKCLRETWVVSRYMDNLNKYTLINKTLSGVDVNFMVHLYTHCDLT